MAQSFNDEMLEGAVVRKIIVLIILEQIVAVITDNKILQFRVNANFRNMGHMRVGRIFFSPQTETIRFLHNSNKVHKQPVMNVIFAIKLKI